MCEIEKDGEMLGRYECATHGVWYCDSDNKPKEVCPVGEAEEKLHELETEWDALREKNPPAIRNCPLVKEALAEHVHTIWTQWMEWQDMVVDLVTAVRGTPGELNHATNAEHVARWKRQMLMPYKILPDWEKSSNRKIADEYLDVIFPKEES
jgi:hypothetical protein